MKIIDRLVEQCKEPQGALGAIMIKTMNVIDAGLNNWAIAQMHDSEGNILDIGCGGGKTVSMLAKCFPGSTVYGVDYSEAAVKATIAKNRQKVSEGKIIISQASVSELPFADHFFACITAIRTHYFWPDLKQNTQEVFRVLNSGGQFLILAELYKIGYHMKEYRTSASLRKLLEDTGFQSVEIYEKKQCICVIARK
jgi:ubiquinone/menaquinone biosynthesis C-methylase UbiE